MVWSRQWEVWWYAKAVSTQFRRVTDWQSNRRADILRQHHPRYAFALRGKNAGTDVSGFKPWRTVCAPDSEFDDLLDPWPWRTTNDIVWLMSADDSLSDLMPLKARSVSVYSGNDMFNVFTDFNKSPFIDKIHQQDHTENAPCIIPTNKWSWY